MRSFILSHADEMCEDCIERAELNPLRAFDCKNDHCREVMADAPLAPDHLCDMNAMLYDTVNENSERGDLPKNMRLEFRERLTYRRTLENADIAALYGMTPYSRRTSRESAERLLSLDKLDITFSFEIFVYAKKEQV